MVELKYLKDIWDDAKAASLESDPVEFLRYRSNLLGADLRTTNFGGGNTSSKVTLADPLTGKPVTVLAVKGSGGDLGSIKKSGFALLYMDRLIQLQSIYRGEAFEDEMVGYYPLCAFGENRVAASIDTPLHAFLPFPHVDHLHPDWAIALAASANGKAKLEEFNKRYNRKMAWLPWQRPGFELGLMLQKLVESNPECDGIVLGSHGLFTWGQTQRECYISSLSTIDQMGEFVTSHQKTGKLFGGPKVEPPADRRETAARILPTLRGALGTHKRSIGMYFDDADALEFANATQAAGLSEMGTSCPDHFLRTRIKPLFIDWNPQTETVETLLERIPERAAAYRADYEAYYKANAEPASPALRDPNASVAIVPGIGMFSFGRNKKEARITGEFFVNAIHVMAGATSMTGGKTPDVLPQVKNPEQAEAFRNLYNYVALPPREAFRIEYWALEEAKLQRMPAEAEYSRKVFFVAGGGSGIGRATAFRLAEGGAHLMIADLNLAAAQETADAIAATAGKETVAAVQLDLRSRESLQKALDETMVTFGGLDGAVNTAAIFPVQNGEPPEQMWHRTLEINVTSNYILAEETKRIFNEQNLPAVLVLTSSANAVVPKRGSEAYDVSKAAVNQLIRGLSVGMAPLVRVNGIAPATVVEGSSMFGRDRVMQSLTKYEIAFSEDDSTEELRAKLAGFYSNRTLTRRPITPRDCANAICWLAGEQSGATSGHLIPVDGGLPEAFLR